MKPATLLTVLLASALAFGQKFDVSDLSASDSPISFTGTTKILKTGLPVWWLRTTTLARACWL